MAGRNGAMRPETISFADAARALGLAEVDLAELIREAGIRLAGPPEGWRLDADDVRALEAERERLRARNLGELAKLADAFDEG